MARVRTPDLEHQKRTLYPLSYAPPGKVALRGWVFSLSFLLEFCPWVLLFSPACVKKKPGNVALVYAQLQGKLRALEAQHVVKHKKWTAKVIYLPHSFVTSRTVPWATSGKGWTDANQQLRHQPSGDWPLVPAGLVSTASPQVGPDSSRRRCSTFHTITLHSNCLTASETGHHYAHISPQVWSPEAIFKLFHFPPKKCVPEQN